MQQPHPHGHIIMIVEDERPLSAIIQSKFEKIDFDTVTARSVEQALTYLDENIPVDVIWLDHYLFGSLNGLDFVAQLKSPDSRWKNIPIFVVSNSVSTDKIQAYLRLGVEKYLTKVEHPLDELVNDVKMSLQAKIKN